MSCTYTTEELSRLPVDERRQHLGDCPDCMARYTRARLVEQIETGGLPQLGTPTMGQLGLDVGSEKPAMDWLPGVLKGAAAFGAVALLIVMVRPGEDPGTYHARSGGGPGAVSWVTAFAVEQGEARELARGVKVKRGSTIGFSYVNGEQWPTLGLALCDPQNKPVWSDLEESLRTEGEHVLDATVTLAAGLPAGGYVLAHGFLDRSFDAASLCRPAKRAGSGGRMKIEVVP